MKLVNKLMAGQKLGTDNGLIEVNANGEVNVDDKAVVKALRNSGFKPLLPPKDQAQAAQTAQAHKGGKQPGKKVRM